MVGPDINKFLLCGLSIYLYICILANRLIG